MGRCPRAQLLENEIWSDMLSPFGPFVVKCFFFQLWREKITSPWHKSWKWSGHSSVVGGFTFEPHSCDDLFMIHGSRPRPYCQTLQKIWKWTASFDPAGLPPCVWPGWEQCSRHISSQLSYMIITFTSLSHFFLLYSLFACLDNNWRDII